MNSYKKLCTEFYDIDKPHAPAEALAFYEHFAQQATGPILEPMCGSGRFLLPLLAQGLPIEGVDASAAMLSACRANAQQRGLTAVLYEQFLHQLAVPQQYQLVIIPAGSFCLLTDPAQVQESLRRLHAAMLPGAAFVLEVEALLSHLPASAPWDGRWVTRPDGAKIVISTLSKYDAATQISHNLHRYELIKDGQLLETEWEELDLRFYTFDEFNALLVGAGFSAIQCFQPYTLQALAGAADTFVFECKKE